MHTRYLVGMLCLGLAGFTGTPAARAGTIITTQWDETQLSQDECLRHASVAIRGGGFDELPHTQQSRHGTHGDYTVAIRCVTEQKFVFFVVAGPSSRTDKYMDDIHSHF